MSHHKVKEAILNHWALTNSKSGLRIVTIKETLNIPLDELKPILDKLESERVFKYRKGINEQLIF